MTESYSTEVATLAGGCFWCLEAVFREVDGVLKVVSGYTGGTAASPTYEQVSTGQTRHAEAVQVTFDPAKVSFREVLEVFFSIHDPTTLDRQGADVGTQYRSAIFYHNEEQRATAEHIVKELHEAHVWKRPIVTQIAAFDRFYAAEDYHQEYFAKHPEQAYCQIVIAPKLTKFRKQWARRLKR